MMQARCCMTKGDKADQRTKKGILRFWLASKRKEKENITLFLSSDSDPAEPHKSSWGLLTI